MNITTASDIRAIWLDLITGRSDVDATIRSLVVAAAGKPTASGFWAEIRSLIDALQSGDLLAETVAWRRSECLAPFGFPSEMPLYEWRFDPITGAALERYAPLRSADQTAPGSNRDTAS